MLKKKSVALMFFFVAPLLIITYCFSENRSAAESSPEAVNGLYFGLCCISICVYTVTHGEKNRDVAAAGNSIRAVYQNTRFFRHVCGIIFAAVYDAFLFAMTFVAILYVIYVMAAGAMRRMESSFYMLIGALPLLAMAVVSLMEFLGVPADFSVQLAAWVCFLMAQGLLLSKRFVNAFTGVQRLSERLSSMDRLKNEFLANTSHEIKTPLHGIINIAQSLLEGAAGRMTPQQEENVAMIVGTGRRMNNLVGDLLDFSKLKNGELVLNRQAVALRPVVRVIFEMFRHLTGAKPMRFIDLLSDRHFVYADEDRLTKILNNLLGNALKLQQQARSPSRRGRRMVGWRFPSRIQESAFHMRSWRSYSNRLSKQEVRLRGSMAEPDLGLVLLNGWWRSMAESFGRNPILGKVRCLRLRHRSQTKWMSNRPRWEKKG